MPDKIPEEDYNDAYELNRLVDAGEVSIELASNADKDRVEQELAGLTALEITEYKNFTKSFPNYKSHPLFISSLFATLIDIILQKINKDAYDKLGALQITSIAKRKITGEIVDQPKDNNSDVEKLLKIETELKRQGDIDKIFEWCKQQQPPIKITQYDKGHLYLYAFRDFNSKIMESGSNKIQ
jgi:hypothetical protein